MLMAVFSAISIVQSEILVLSGILAYTYITLWVCSVQSVILHKSFCCRGSVGTLRSLWSATLVAQSRWFVFYSLWSSSWVWSEFKTPTICSTPMSTIPYSTPISNVPYSTPISTIPYGTPISTIPCSISISIYMYRYSIIHMVSTHSTLVLTHIIYADNYNHKVSMPACVSKTSGIHDGAINLG